MSRSLTVVELLFATFPLIRLTHGEKRARIQQAWIAAAHENALNVLKVEESLLPPNPRAAAEALLRLALQNARQQGFTPIELGQFFNNQADTCQLMLTVSPDDTLEASHALLAMMAARRLQARDPIHTEERKQA